MKKQYQAFLFDLNGTLIDDMHFHISAWHKIVNDLGANLSYEETKLECYGKNEELLERIFPNRFTPEEKAAMSLEKETVYQREFKPHMKLLPGLSEVLAAAHAKNIIMTIGSAAIRFNVDFVLDNLNIRHYFKSIVCAEDVKHSKPDPETFLKNALQSGVAPSECLVFEDAPKGVEAAANAGMDCFVLTTMHEAHEFSAYSNTIGFANDYLNFKPA